MNFSENEIKNLILKIYDLEGNVKILPGEIDLNFQLQTKDGARYTFKIANPGETRENLEFQNALMLHLLSKQLGLEVPQVIFTVDRELITTIVDKAGKKRFTRLLSWVEGRPFATVNPHTPNLLLGLGNLCGKLCVALQDFDHEAAHRFIKWDLAQCDWIKPHWKNENDPYKRDQFDYFYSLYENVVKPIESSLPKSVIYNDLNDYNVLVSHDLANPKVPGVIDFGDAVYSHRVNELAIALTYSLMHKPDPMQAAHYIVKGYHQICPLSQDELEALFPLIGMRLLISVTCSRLNRDEDPDNSYLQISDNAAWELLKKLRAISPRFAYYSFREACGMEPHPSKELFKKWCHKNASSFKSIMGQLEEGQVHWLDLSMGSLELGNQSNILDGIKLDERIRQVIRHSGKPIGLGKYNEVRPFYTSHAFEHESNDGPEWRTVHIGLDIFVAAEEPIFAPINGVVYSVVDNAGDRNYGPTVILQHDVEPGLRFYTLYGHLSRSTLMHLKPGDQVLAGDQFSSLGNFGENGGWSPHLHFQIILDLLGKHDDFPGVALPAQIEIWKSICPNPWLLIDGSNSHAVLPEMNTDLIAYRKSHMGKNLSLSYHFPLRMERGYGQYLYDSNGRKYLDTVNNVAHVGHEHPRVVSAGQNQMAVLNTNTRYLHKNIINFTEALLETLPKELEVAYVVNSGSEANELALRIAKTYTHQQDMIVVEIGYHGNTNACIEASSYKFDRKGGKGAPDHIHVVPIPDNYRGIYRNEADSGKKYASHIGDAIEKLQSQGKGMAAFICESVLSCGGQVVLPEGYLQHGYELVREAGGVCIADEVQTGCGRAGDYFWAFESQGVIPDIVTIGKPIGNGHPLGAVVTTRKLADAFANGMEYFNTFGGNPVSSAIGYEVLNVIKDEGLQQNAKEVGMYLQEGLKTLQKSFPIIGDVRGLGLFIGFELVKNDNLDPATAQATYLVNRMCELGVLMSSDGPYENVIKIKPPLGFSTSDSDFLLSTLERVFNEDYMKI